MPKFTVIVGNIGTVYTGPDYMIAVDYFADYKQQSKNGIGRAAGEDVTLMEDDEINNFFAGSAHKLTA